MKIQQESSVLQLSKTDSDPQSNIIAKNKGELPKFAQTIFKTVKSKQKVLSEAKLRDF